MCDFEQCKIVMHDEEPSTQTNKQMKITQQLLKVANFIY